MLMILLALLLAAVLITIDRNVQLEGIEVLGALFPKGTQSAGTLLSAIATSILTVTGSIFSIVIVAIQLASGQFGPRMLRDFMHDRVNQFTLGVCGATFIYELAILWAIEDSKDISFTPQISVFVGFLLAIISTFVIIYFVHHIAEIVHADNLIARIGHDSESSIHKILPKVDKQKKDRQQTNPSPADQTRQIQEIPADFEEKAIALPSHRSGYIQQIDYDALCAIAAQHHLILKLLYRPGQFAVEDSKLLYAYSEKGAKTAASPGLSPGLDIDINKTFTCGNQRKPESDLEFPIKQLVEIAIRAISPAVNDPFTAIRCIDRLTMLLCQIAQKAPQSIYRFDDDRQLRLIINPVTFDAMIRAAFDQIRQYGQTDVSVTLRLLEAIERIGEQCHTQQQKRSLRRQADMIQRGGQNPDSIPEENDRQDILQQYNKTIAALAQ